MYNERFFKAVGEHSIRQFTAISQGKCPPVLLMEDADYRDEDGKHGNCSTGPLARTSDTKSDV
jgi:hypothetical protein